MAAAFLTNVLFWGGVDIGGVVFAALLQVTGGEWAGSARVIAERFRRFLPISFGAIVFLMWRSGDVYPWARQAVTSPWFNPRFAAFRVDVASAAVYACAFAFCRASRRLREGATDCPATRRAVLFLVVYALGLTMIAVDAIMSLEPRWTSTLFPAYIFTGNVYSGIAAVAALAAWDAGPSQAAMSRARSRDMANLLVGMALFWIYLFWSQFLVIWYGNLTSEVGYVMARLDPRRVTAWAVLVMCCAIPAIVLVPRWGKQITPIKIVAPVILIGMWFEKWLLVAPDVKSRFPIAGGLVITAAFAGLFKLSLRPPSDGGA